MQEAAGRHAEGLELFGHPFSSYTWKALIALYANETSFTFRMIGPDCAARVAAASPLGKFPLLADGGVDVFEATAIIEHLWLYHRGAAPLLPDDPAQAARARMLDRVFDNYVMGPTQAVVNEYLLAPQAPDMARVERARADLDRAYAWLEKWLEHREPPGPVGLVECAAAPALFYADWVHPVAGRMPRLAAYRAQLLALPPVARCVEDARPYRKFFPLGAPDRD